MLEFILGEAGCGKTALLYEKILHTDGDVLVFVPDQFMFETEKIIASLLCERTHRVKITGFSALAEEITSRFAPRKTYADSTAKLLIMLRTIRTLQGSLRYYGTAAATNSFPRLMLSAVNLFKDAGVTPDRLSQINCTTNGLADKLYDLTAIYSLYRSQLNAVYDDRQDNLPLAADLASQKDYFAGCNIFINGFDSFTGAQLKFLEPMIRQCDNCTAVFCTDDSGRECFLPVDKTVSILTSFAQKEFAEIKRTVLSGDKKYRSEALAQLRNGLFGENAAEYAEQQSAVTLAAASDADGEIEYVCSEIRRLMKQGMRCSDIAVLCADPSVYLGTAKSIFARYEIPLFADIPTPISEKPLLRYIDFLLNAAADTRGENVLRYIKSGFVRLKAADGKTRPVTLREIHDIEAYCACWGLYGRDWARPFAKTETETEKRVELIRKQVTEPLIAFRKSCQGCDGAQITKLLTDFLFDKADISAAIQGKCQDYTTRELRYNKERTEEYNNLWETVGEMLTSAYQVLSGMEISLGSYAAILKSCCEQITMSAPPQVLDSVLFGDPERTRTAGVKAVFVMGASDGAFPKSACEDGIFSPSESEELIKNGLAVAQSGDEAYYGGMLTVYKALTLASERLYVTWCGGKEAAGAAVEDIISILPSLGIIDIDKLTAPQLCMSREAAKTQLARRRFTDKQGSEEIRQALSDTGEKEFLRLVERARKGLSDTACLHNAGEAAQLLFPAATLSPTAIEKLCACRFAYFCRYGLKLKDPATRTMNPMNFGNIVHFVMSECLQVVLDKEKSFSREETARLVEDSLACYLEEFFLPEQEMSARFMVIYKNIARLCCELLVQMKEEAENSCFTPRYFELSLEKGKVLPDGFRAEPFSLDFELPDGTRSALLIKGTVDRVDTAEADGRKWIKVIDYKTGEKDINIGKIYYGLDLQLLLYLFTLCENNAEFSPSSALYYPAGNIPLSDRRKTDPEVRRAMWLKTHAQKGIAVKSSPTSSEKRLYDAMDYTSSGNLRNYNYYSATEVSEQALDRLKDRIGKVVGENAARIKAGDVAACPIVSGDDYISCRYCRMSDICGRNSLHTRDVDGESAAEFGRKIVTEEEEK